MVVPIIWRIQKEIVMQTQTQETSSPVTHKPVLKARARHGAALFIGSLSILVALFTLAPITGAGQPSGKMSPAFLMQDAGAGSGPLFLSGVNYRVPLQDAGSLAAADVNGDGKPDVVVATVCVQVAGCHSFVSVLLGNGDGTLQPAVSYDSGGTLALSITVADVNGDGKPDILVAECGPTQCASGAHGLVGVLLGKGDGTFHPAVTYDSGGAGANAVAVADINGDGRPDLIVTSCAFSGSSCSHALVNVLLGNGDGTFQAAVTHGTGALSANAVAVAVADLNGDGKPDLIVTNTVSTFGLSVLLGNGDGSFKPAVTHNFGGLGFSVEAADLNGDGKVDVVMASCVAGGTGCTSSVSVLLGKGDGTFQPVVNYSSGGREANSIAIADVNGDSTLDLLVANRFANTSTNGVMGALLGNGDGTFQTVHPFGAGKGSAPSVTVADVNGDGRLDALVGNGVVSVLLNGSAPIATTTNVTTSVSPSIFGQSVKFTATTQTSVSEIPDGETVTFHDGTAVIGTGMTASGLATFSTSSLKVGGHSIQAVYPGDGSFRPSTGRVTQVVSLDPTMTSLTSSPNPSTHGQPVIFTARVTSAGPNTATGKVAFKDGTTVIGSATLSGGVATITKSSLAVGTHPITAAYSGNSTSAKSTSAVLNQIVN